MGVSAEDRHAGSRVVPRDADQHTPCGGVDKMREKITPASFSIVESSLLKNRRVGGHQNVRVALKGVRQQITEVAR